MPADCRCATPPFRFGDFQSEVLGEDAGGAEVSLHTCRTCGRAWLKYLIEEPHFSRSGRWWRVPLAPGQAQRLTADLARGFIERQAWGFIGGSFFASAGRRVDAPIQVM
jgi:hypothetical protein